MEWSLKIIRVEFGQWSTRLLIHRVEHGHGRFILLLFFFIGLAVIDAGHLAEGWPHEVHHFIPLLRRRQFTFDMGERIIQTIEQDEKDPLLSSRSHLHGQEDAQQGNEDENDEREKIERT